MMALKTPNTVLKYCRRCLSTSGSPSNAVSAYTWRNTDNSTSTISGPLTGKKIAIKDNIFYRGSPSTCSSNVLKDFDPPYNATCVEALLQAGATVSGKTQMDEFGMGSNTTNLPPGSPRVVNPFPGPGEERSAGGSSGGSAMAVAEGSVYAALGTDTGGSVRLPASYCGVVGLKPSYGLISRHGVVSYADSLDCVGIVARDIEAVQQVLSVISHPDPANDLTCAPTSKRTAIKQRTIPLSSLRIGIPIETSATPPPRSLLAFLKSQGATIQAVSIPSTPHALAAYYTIASAEASSSLARFGGGWWGQDRELFGNEVKKRILAGTWALTADAFNNYYLKALQLRSTLRTDFDALFNPQHEDQGIDVVLHPTTPSIAPLLNATGPGYAQDILTTPASLAGLPALSVPCGLEDGWPRGLSLVTRWGDERVLLDLGRHVEQWVHEQ